MNKKRLVFLFGLLLCVTALLSAFGRKEKDTTPARMVVQVSGVVRLTGSEPFTEIVITSSDRGQWYIARDEMYKLYDLQYQTVTVRRRNSYGPDVCWRSVCRKKERIAEYQDYQS